MAITYGVGAAGTVNSASGGKVYAFNNLSMTPQVVAPANPARAQITFHNPGSVDAFVAPVTQVVNGANQVLTPTTSLLGGTLRVFGNGGTLMITGECQLAWQAFSLSGMNNPLTIVDSNLASS